MSWAPDYDWPPTREQREAALEAFPWGDGSRIIGLWPRAANDPKLIEWAGRLERLSASPGTARKLFMMNAEVDIRAVLPSISVPTLVVHRAQDRFVDVRHSRYLADHIPGARYVELPGDEVFSFGSGQDSLVDEVEEFLTGARRAPHPERVLATVMFSDIVGSTQRAAELGDRRWRDVLSSVEGTVSASCPSTGVARSSRWATGFLPRSTDPRAGSAVRSRSATPSKTSSGCRCEADCTPARSS